MDGLLGLAGATHALELVFLFDNFEAYEVGYEPTGADRAVVELMQSTWTTFAREGHPPEGLVWPPYAEDSPAIGILADPFEIASEIREGRCDELRALGLVR